MVAYMQSFMDTTGCFLRDFHTLHTIPLMKKSLSLFTGCWTYVRTPRKLAKLCNRNKRLALQSYQRPPLLMTEYEEIKYQIKDIVKKAEKDDNINLSDIATLEQLTQIA